MRDHREETLYQRVHKEKTVTIELTDDSLKFYNGVREYLREELRDWLEGKEIIDPKELMDIIIEFGDDYFEGLLEKEDSLTSPVSMSVRIAAAFLASNLEDIVKKIVRGQDSIEKA